MQLPGAAAHVSTPVSTHEGEIHESAQSDGEALHALANSPETGPVVMLNLLKFGGPGGREAYTRYGAAVAPILAAIGARVLYSGRATLLLVGDQTWDAVILVEYPSRQAFLQMISSPEYLQAHAERERGLERTVLYATQPMQGV